LIIENEDIPGTVGTVTTLIGARKINIADVSWGRNKPGGRAMTVINLDDPAPSDLVEEIRRQPNILSAKAFAI
jgi:D-3-phosphoglycerate dehydrogenase